MLLLLMCVSIFLFLFMIFILVSDIIIKKLNFSSIFFVILFGLIAIIVTSKYINYGSPEFAEAQYAELDGQYSLVVDSFKNHDYNNQLEEIVNYNNLRENTYEMFSMRFNIPKAEEMMKDYPKIDLDSFISEIFESGNVELNEYEIYLKN